LIVLALVMTGAAIHLYPSPDLAGVGGKANSAVSRSFERAVAQLQQKQYAQAASTLHEVLKNQPRLPEAHVNMGYALLGLHRYVAARTAFEAAIRLRPSQLNAYFGLALAESATGRTAQAIHAMRIYVQLAGENDPYRDRARQALNTWLAAVDPGTS